MKEDKEYVIPLDKENIKKIGNDILRYVDIDGKWHKEYTAEEVIEELQERIDKAIEYINEMCLCSEGYANYGDDLRPEHIVDILQGKDKGDE